MIVNGKMEDLVGERAIHHKVDQCFTKIEMGAHFTGDGYSVVGMSVGYNSCTIFTLLEKI